MNTFQRASEVNELPAFTRVLTDGGRFSVLRLPSGVGKHLCAIETGVKRAVILHDESEVGQARPLISQLRGRLAADEYNLEAYEVVCEPGIIEKLLEGVRVPPSVQHRSRPAQAA